jgi:hypothetical protein
MTTQRSPDTARDDYRRKHLLSRARDHFRDAKSAFRIGNNPNYPRSWWQRYGIAHLARACDYLAKIRELGE